MNLATPKGVMELKWLHSIFIYVSTALCLFNLHTVSNQYASTVTVKRFIFHNIQRHRKKILRETVD